MATKSVKSSFSAKSRAAKLNAAEKKSVGTKSKPKAVAKPKAKSSTYKPPAKGVAARQAAIDAARRADEAAIRAMKAKKKK